VKNLGVYIYDIEKTQLRYHVSLPYSDNALGISFDAKYVIVGFGTYSLFEWDALHSSYVSKVAKTVREGYYVSVAKVLSTGSYITALSSFDAKQIILEAYTVNGVNTWQWEGGVSAVLQDTAYALQVSDDEEFLIMASWGNDTGSHNPTGRVWDLKTASGSQAQPIWTLSTSGSSFCCDIAHSNGVLEIVVGGKSVHANLMARGGDLYYNSVNIKRH